jgi:hypothetical protein
VTQEQMLFHIEQKSRHPKRVVRTAYFDEKELINDIMFLHNDGLRFDLDPTYSVGRFWKGLPGPLLKYDLVPQVDGVKQADCRKLPLKDNQIESLMFDPPFIAEGLKSNSLIKDRFSSFDSLDELKAMYLDSLIEFYRILKPNGLVVFKCQDLVRWHKQFLTHVWVINEAARVGFYTKDLFILIRDNVLLSAHVKKQQHARKTHSYFLVLVKATPNKDMAQSVQA